MQEYITKEVTVAELKELYHVGEYDIEISTPDGFCAVTNWFDKGVLEMVRVTTESGLVTECAYNHFLQLDGGDWKPASGVQIDDLLLTEKSDNDRVISVEKINSEECYDFTVDHPNHRYWGDGFSSHNSGKSYICSGNLVRHAQEMGIFPVLIDSENGCDESWLNALGVDTSPEKLLKLNMAMIDDVAKTISEFMKDYRAMPEEERPKVLFIVDSLGMLLTPTDTDQFGRGELKGDMGRKPKALNALVRNCVNMFGEYEVGLVCTNHTYASQDPYSPDPNISGGCLTAGHKVQLADGSVKAIEEIKIGDVVRTLDGDNEVSHTHHFTDKEVFEIDLECGSVIQATGEHKFMILNSDGCTEWKELNDLSEGDEILKVE